MKTTINDKFSFRRLWAVMKLDIVVNYKRYIGTLIILLIAFWGYQLMQVDKYLEMNVVIPDLFPVDKLFENFVASVTANFGVILLFAIYYASSEMSLPIKTKEKALNFLVMPVTSLEKFISRFLVAVVGVPVIAIVALLLADMLRMLCLPLFDGPTNALTGFTLPDVFANFVELFRVTYSGVDVNRELLDGQVAYVSFDAYMGCMAIACMVLSWSFNQSLFMLAGCIWRKRALVKAFLVILLAVILVVGAMVTLPSYWIPWFRDTVMPLMTVDSVTKFCRIILSVITPILLLLTILNWWLSYRLFSRKQVVSVNRIKLFKRRKEAAV